MRPYGKITITLDGRDHGVATPRAWALWRERRHGGRSELRGRLQRDGQTRWRGRSRDEARTFVKSDSWDDQRRCSQ